jgi:hypothetical protein
MVSGRAHLVAGEALQSIADWLRAHEALAWGLTILPIASFLVSVTIVGILITRIPRDYFAAPLHRSPRTDASSDRRRIGARVARNIVALLLVLAGLIMLFTPGQGLLTVLVGLMLSDLPGKYRFECWLVRRPAVRRSVDWIRVKAGGEPLEL